MHNTFTRKNKQVDTCHAPFVVLCFLSELGVFGVQYVQEKVSTLGEHCVELPQSYTGL